MDEMSKPVAAVSPATLARMIAVVGEKNAITDKDKQTPYLVEFRALWTGHTPVVLRPVAGPRPQSRLDRTRGRKRIQGARLDCGRPGGGRPPS